MCLLFFVSTGSDIESSTTRINPLSLMYHSVHNHYSQLSYFWELIRITVTVTVIKFTAMIFFRINTVMVEHATVFMKLLGDVMQYLFHVLLVHSKEIVQDSGRSHPPESLSKLVDTAHRINIIRVTHVKTVVYQQRCH